MWNTEGHTNFFYNFFFASGVGSPLYPEILQYYTMILQRPRIIVGDAELEPGPFAPEVWRATKWATTSHSNPFTVRYLSLKQHLKYPKLYLNHASVPLKRKLENNSDLQSQ